MKILNRYLVVWMLGLALSLCAWTGASAEPTFELGLKAGVGVAKLHGGDTEGLEVFSDEDLGITVESDITDLKLGFVGGGYVMLHVTDQFGARVEALYFQKGGKGEFSGEITTPVTASYDGEATFTLDYFEVPLLGVVTFPAGPSGKVELFAGPSVGFNANAKAKVEVNVDGESSEEEEDIEDIKSIDFSGVVGAGFVLSLAKVNLFAEARYMHGFTKVDDSDAKADIKTSAFGFMVGIGFPLLPSVTP